MRSGCTGTVTNSGTGFQIRQKKEAVRPAEKEDEARAEATRKGR